TGQDPAFCEDDLPNREHDPVFARLWEVDRSEAEDQLDYLPRVEKAHLDVRALDERSVQAVARHPAILERDRRLPVAVRQFREHGQLRHAHWKRSGENGLEESEERGLLGRSVD